MRSRFVASLPSFFVLLVVLGMSERLSAEPLLVYSKQTSVEIVSAGGETLLSIRPLVWGPNWTPGHIHGDLKGEATSVSSHIEQEIPTTKAPFVCDYTVKSDGPQRLIVDVSFKVERDTQLQLFCLGITPGAQFKGIGQSTVTDADGARILDVPFKTMRLSKTAKQLEIRDAQGKAFVMKTAEPAILDGSGEARLVLADGQLKVGETRTLSVVVDLPAEATFALMADDAAATTEMKQWFPWTATSAIDASVIGMSDWLEAPAGKHGRITRDKDLLLYDGKPIKIWGINDCYGEIFPTYENADHKSAFYAKYGINAVRMHKFADGNHGYCKGDSATSYDPALEERMDYYISKLKEHGIYVELSSNFGSLSLGPADVKRLSFGSELKLDKQGWARASQGALWFSPELQDIQIKQIVDVLNRKNANTGMTNAADPAIAFVELVNENSIFFGTTLGAMKSTPTIKKMAGQAFFEWLKKKYGTQEKLVAAWGDGTLNFFGGKEQMGGESWQQGLIYPFGAPWYFAPEQLDGQMKPQKQRLLDTIQFFYQQQSAVYQKMVAAIRATGYSGEIIGSNWQAGHGFSHYLNLNTDAELGLVDRHNYFESKSSMLANPGSGMLSTGMQQVADHPFMLSEWIHVFPNEYAVEGPAIIGAYGLGLNGWDASFIFQKRAPGTFNTKLGDEWNVTVPQVLGAFPAIARQVLSGDVKTSEVAFARNVNVDALKRGEIGFVDRVQQTYDAKEFGSDAAPAAALAVGANVVRYPPDQVATDRADLKSYIKKGIIHSATGQLAWKPGDNPQDGYFTIDAAGTKALVGFTNGITAELGDVAITSHNPFAAIYVSAITPGKTIANDQHLLITTVGRVRNTGMVVVAGDVIKTGAAPLLVEPISIDLQLKRGGNPTVTILDHDGRRTEKTVPVTNGRIVINGLKRRRFITKLPTRERFRIDIDDPSAKRIVGILRQLGGGGCGYPHFRDTVGVS